MASKSNFLACGDKTNLAGLALALGTRLAGERERGEKVRPAPETAAALELRGCKLAKLRGDSVSSKSSLDPLTCADTEASAQSQQRGTEELAEVSRALAALREAVTPLAPEGRASACRGMAPGVGGF